MNVYNRAAQVLKTSGLLACSGLVGWALGIMTECQLSSMVASRDFCLSLGDDLLFMLSELPMTIALTVTLGFPAHLVLSRFRLGAWWHYAIAGFILAAPVWCMYGGLFWGEPWDAGTQAELLGIFSTGVWAALVFWWLQRQFLAWPPSQCEVLGR